MLVGILEQVSGIVVIIVVILQLQPNKQVNLCKKYEVTLSKRQQERHFLIDKGLILGTRYSRYW